MTPLWVSSFRLCRRSPRAGARAISPLALATPGLRQARQDPRYVCQPQLRLHPSHGQPGDCRFDRGGDGREDHEPGGEGRQGGEGQRWDRIAGLRMGVGWVPGNVANHHTTSESTAYSLLVVAPLLPRQLSSARDSASSPWANPQWPSLLIAKARGTAALRNFR